MQSKGLIPCIRNRGSVGGTHYRFRAKQMGSVKVRVKGRIKII